MSDCYRTNDPDIRAARSKAAVARATAWKAANKEKVKALNADYRERKKDERKAYNAEYRARNIEAVREAHRAWREANKERIRARNAEYRKTNKERERANAAAWRAANPEAARAIIRNRRARLRKSEGSHTATDIEALFSAQKGKCAECRTSIRRGYHVDHIKPIALGGSNYPKNLQLLCGTCNRRKGSFDPIEWARRSGRLV